MYDVIIVGAGPSGMSAALYALRANKKVLILEKECYGGQIINASNIENYPAIPTISGFDFATNLYNQIKKLGVEFKYEEVIEITNEKEVKTSKNTYKAKSIIIATGLKKRKLNILNEDKLLGKGISYCATCDGNFFKDRVVAVVGGGNTALEDAIYLSNITKKVYLIHRRDSFKMNEKILENVKNSKNIEIIFNSVVDEVLGNENSTAVGGIAIKNVLNNEITKITLDGVFVAIGRQPATEFLKNTGRWYYIKYNAKNNYR